MLTTQCIDLQVDATDVSKLQNNSYIRTIQVDSFSSFVLCFSKVEI